MKLEIAEPMQTSKGSKIALLKGDELNLKLQNVISPFGYGVFGGDGQERRVNLDINVSELVYHQLFEEIDEEIIKIATQQSSTLFRKTLTEKEIRQNYRPILKTSDTYEPKLRTKINLDKINFWDQQCEPTKVPTCKLKLCTLNIRGSFKSIWIMPSGQFGASFECSDIQYSEPIFECPF